LINGQSKKVQRMKRKNRKKDKKERLYKNAFTFENLELNKKKEKVKSSQKKNAFY